jgi:hypothetical protein
MGRLLNEDRSLVADGIPWTVFEPEIGPLGRCMIVVGIFSMHAELKSGQLYLVELDPGYTVSGYLIEDANPLHHGKKKASFYCH